MQKCDFARRSGLKPANIPEIAAFSLSTCNAAEKFVEWTALARPAVAAWDGNNAVVDINANILLVTAAQPLEDEATAHRQGL